MQNISYLLNEVQKYYQRCLMESLNISQDFKHQLARIQDFPLKVKMFLISMIRTFNTEFTPSVPKAIERNYQPIMRAFKELSPAQKLHAISSSITKLQQYLSRQSNSEQNSVNDIVTTCQIKSSFLGMTSWDKKSFRFSHKVMQIKMETNKKGQLIQLKNYLVRKSKNDKHTLVFQSIEPKISQKLQKISVKFKNDSISEEIYRVLRDAVGLLFQKRLQLLLKENGTQQTQSQMHQSDFAGLLFLNRKNINQYFDKKENFVSKLKRKRRKSKMVYSQNNLRIFKSSNSKYYYLQYESPFQDQQTAKRMTNIFEIKTVPGVYHCQKLQSFAASISANYYKLMSDKDDYEFIMLVQKHQKSNQSQQWMYSVGNNNETLTITFIFIEFLLIKKKYHYRISLISPPKHRLQTKEVCKVMLNMINTPAQQSIILQQTSTMEGTGSESFHSKKVDLSFTSQRSSPNDSSSDQKEKLPSIQQEQQDQVFYSMNNFDEDDIEESITYSQKIMPLMSSQHSEDFKVISLPKLAQRISIQSNFSKSKPFFKPQAKTQPKIIKQHFMFGDWQRGKKGGVVCVNEEVINAQKKVIKAIVSQLGSNFSKMKGLSNISLPIFICKPESALTSISKNLSYAPMLLQETDKTSPIERIKRLAILQISMAALALSMQKPLNPILGQTYQGQIDGCPIFAQQISHHPPITYLYMVGRGYKIYGSVGPQVALRLNYILGMNEKLLTVQFDNGDKCQLSLPIMVINGVIFGQRSIYFQGSNYIVDYANNLITEIVYNAKSKGFFAFKNKQAPDYLHGQIYQVHPAFMQKFKANDKKISPKKDQRNKLVRQFSGQWNAQIRMNNQVFFDFQTNLPFEQFNYEGSLPSDSTQRPDIQLMLKDDIKRAQQQKDSLQQLQRKDKKMRASAK